MFKLCLHLATSIACVSLLLDSHLCVTLKCPSGWIRSLSSRSCLKIDWRYKTWFSSRDACKVFGGDLLNRFDNKIKTTIYGKNFSFANIFFWSGLNDLKKKGDFTWLYDTQKITNIPWKKGEPTSLIQNQDCTYFKLDYIGQVVFFDEYCDRSHHFICEIFPACSNNTFGMAIKEEDARIHAVNKRLEQTVLKPAAKSVVDQTTLATTSMDPAFLVVLLDIKETDAKINVITIHLELTVQKPAVRTVQEKTKPATTLMVTAFSVVSMDMKEKDAINSRGKLSTP
ncbi:hypothetical protein RRG08_010109 [Elysia crispata]|uniref:C-type lectin domain-containing protein n=1 Tax=Elysia crispata TaxID=231223 RepID=A0AAE1D6M3_9GAST|nr:hypothetical protein RRG08_010109 [Elysia crispata]